MRINVSPKGTNGGKCNKMMGQLLLFYSSTLITLFLPPKSMNCVLSRTAFLNLFTLNNS